METIDIDIDDDLLFSLMILAHERDITLNQNINFILSEFLSEPSSQLILRLLEILSKENLRIIHSFNHTDTSTFCPGRPNCRFNSIRLA